ncbi:hypothetical protein CIT31_19610 [Mesorhizobium wenxiniae]|uniref:Uncharacterized protein n=1 Tax=Mesorhizobium wenxiniae TaxID=2014805 RepID=A0A271KFD4_9HYPH|nr:hypothetical protein CIT31_19610 [Mesorhizobium wenxiniae]
MLGEPISSSILIKGWGRAFESLHPLQFPSRNQASKAAVRRGFFVLVAARHHPADGASLSLRQLPVASRRFVRRAKYVPK